MKALRMLATAALLAASGCDSSGGTNPPSFSVDGDVALGSLMALGDGNLRQLEDHFGMLAATQEARSADWERVRGPLSAVDRLVDTALLWFAMPDGTYWSVQEGPAEATLADRAYWPRLMDGETVIGDLLVSRATGRSAAIVAVPVLDDEGAVIAVLGGSVFLETLGGRIRREMNLGEDHLFFAMNDEPLVGLHSDPDLIFLYPLAEGDPELERAVQELLAGEEGRISYRFRGRDRTVLYRRSEVSGWWYAFGVRR